MNLLSGLSTWLDARRRAREDHERGNPASRESMRLTFSWGRRKVDLAIGESSDGASPAADKATSASADTGPAAMPDDDADKLLDEEPVASREPQQNTPPLAFWDALEPTEREAIRAMAFLRTFAAGASIMDEGERADHVMVILGGRVEIHVEENGADRVIAVRGVGQLVGERGALKVSIRSATVVARDMVWALVVHTKDFAAFLTAHPRAMRLVRVQLDQRGIEDLTGSEPDSGHRDGFQPEYADSRAVHRGLHHGSRGEHPVRRSRPLNGENCTVFLTDVVEFGSRMRTDDDRLLIREALFKMTQTAMQAMPGARSEDRGDGFLTIVPPDVSTARVVDQLLKEFPVTLDLYNSIQRESARFKLRLAVNVGPVVSDMGVSGEAIIVAARLVEAPQFKDAITGSNASLGFIASPFVYETVIRHRADSHEVVGYSKVPVEVKESDTTAWMKLFGSPMPSPLVSHRPVPQEPYPRSLTSIVQAS